MVKADVHQSNETSLGLMIVKSYVKDKLKGKLQLNPINRELKPVSISNRTPVMLFID